MTMNYQICSHINSDPSKLYKVLPNSCNIAIPQTRSGKHLIATVGGLVLFVGLLFNFDSLFLIVLLLLSVGINESLFDIPGQCKECFLNVDVGFSTGFQELNCKFISKRLALLFGNHLKYRFDE